MATFSPLVNLLVLMTALSVAAERLANLVKLSHPDLRAPGGGMSWEERKQRERRIANRVLIVSVLLALAVKADFFAIISHLDAPWETLGWIRYAVRAPSDVVSTVAGTILTGLSLGFGSKFWHDVLDLVYGLGTAVRRGARSLPE